MGHGAMVTHGNGHIWDIWQSSHMGHMAIVTHWTHGNGHTWDTRQWSYMGQKAMVIHGMGPMALVTHCTYGSGHIDTWSRDESEGKHHTNTGVSWIRTHNLNIRSAVL